MQRGAESHDSDVGRPASYVGLIHGDRGNRIPVRVYIPGHIRHQTDAGICRNPNLATGVSTERPISVGYCIDHRRVIVNVQIGISCKPLGWLRGVYGVESAIAAERVLPGAAAGRATGPRRAIILRSSQQNVRARRVYRERYEFRHRSQSLAQAVKLVGSGATAGVQPGIAIERAADSSVMCEVAGRLAACNSERDSVLIGMNMRWRAERPRIASIGVGEIDPVALRAGGAASEGALIEIDRACINVGCSPVGNRRERQIVITLLHAAAAIVWTKRAVTAVGDSVVWNLIPVRSAV